MPNTFNEILERLARLETQMTAVMEESEKTAAHVDEIKHQRSWLLGGVAGIMGLIAVAGTLATSTVVGEIREAKDMQRVLMQRMSTQIGAPAQKAGP